MTTHDFILGALVVLAAAVVSVPLSKKFGLGSVLGYLLAGAIIGPSGLALITSIDSIRSFSEFGVVLLMFLVGLELLPRRLWKMRVSVFGYGALQVAGVGAVLAGLALAAGFSPKAAAIAGLGLALSSTAFALQVLAERNQLATPQGRDAFSILLFQDIAVIPMMLLVEFLGEKPNTSSWPLFTAIKTVLVCTTIFILGRYILKHFFRFVAQTHSQEVFTAATLLLVFGVGLLVEQIGLSMAFGAFVSGLLLADCDYRHELEADIEPFKGLLLGLFFVAVGMSVNFSTLVQQPGRVVGWTVGFVAIKMLLIYGLARAVSHRGNPARILAIAISQGGEFAFVLYSAATSQLIFDQATADFLTLVVTLSMGTTPLLFLLNDRLLQRFFPDGKVAIDTALPESDSRVVIAGFGRFGQIVARVLTLRGIPFTALDQDPNHIAFVRSFGSQVYFGDCTRLDLLRAAKIEKAEVLVIAVDNVEASLKTAQLVQHEFPHVKILARARNRDHVYRLMALGVQAIERETFGSSLETARTLLVEIGLPQSVADQTIAVFRQHDEDMLKRAYQHHGDMDKLKEIAKAGRQELQALFQEDVKK